MSFLAKQALHFFYLLFFWSGIYISGCYYKGKQISSLKGFTHPSVSHRLIIQFRISKLVSIYYKTFLHLACGARIGSANNGDCFKSKGSQIWCTLRGKRYEFFKFDFKGRVRTTFLIFTPIPPVFLV